jgi:hypothetical protein
MGRSFVEGLSDDLTRRYHAQHGEPGDPAADLKLMREELFDPVSREERLRRELDGLRGDLEWSPPEGTPEILVLPIGNGAYLITPEGRLTMPVLTNALRASSGSDIVIDELDISAAEHLLADSYRDWVRYRLNRVLALREGQGRAMLPAAIGTVLFLLVNGNIGKEWALTQPKEPTDQKRLDEAVTVPIQAFVEGIGESGRSSGDRRHLQLYNGYGLSEARRRMGQDIVLERDPVNPEAKRLYIAPETELRTVAALARELRGRNVDSEHAGRALDRFMAVYEEQRPRISAYGVSNARPSRTQRFRRALLKDL